MNNWGEQTRLVFRLAVGLYLIYLAYQLFSAQLAGGTDMPDWVAYGGGGAFCAFSLVRYFRQRRADRDKEQAPRMEDDL